MPYPPFLATTTTDQKDETNKGKKKTRHIGSFTHPVYSTLSRLIFSSQGYLDHTLPRAVSLVLIFANCQRHALRSPLEGVWMAFMMR